MCSSAQGEYIPSLSIRERGYNIPQSTTALRIHTDTSQAKSNISNRLTSERAIFDFSKGGKSGPTATPQEKSHAIPEKDSHPNSRYACIPTEPKLKVSVHADRAICTASALPLFCLAWARVSAGGTPDAGDIRMCASADDVRTTCACVHVLSISAYVLASLCQAGTRPKGQLACARCLGWPVCQPGQRVPVFWSLHVSLNRQVS